MLAMRFAGVDYGNTSIGPVYIFNACDQSQMKGIAARGIITDDMVKNEIICSLRVPGNGTDKPSVYNTMDQFMPAIYESLSVSLRKFVPSPDPAFPQRINGIDLDSGKKSVDGACVKMGNCEIIESSHSMPPIQVSLVRSGAGSCPSPFNYYIMEQELYARRAA